MTVQIGRLKLTTDLNKTSCAAHTLRIIRAGIFASAVFFLLAGQNDLTYAQATAASQTTPEKKVDLGVGAVSDSSFKFGEYNGLQNSGPFGIGNFDFRGGAPYDSKSTFRWQMRGTNLGLENRSLYAEFAKQGKFRFYAGYSELRANRSDTYQTPYLGIGTGSLTIPSNWLFPAVPQRGATSQNFRVFDPVAGSGSYYNSSGVLTAPTPAQLATGASIRAADLPDFHSVYLSTKRTKFEAGVIVDASDKLDIPVSYSYEHKSGLKELGAVTSQVAENAVMLPIPIDFDTSQANAAVNFKVKHFFLTIAYYGSFFKDNVTSMTWQDVADPTKSATMATAPSNQFNQFTFVGAEKFKDNMKLVVLGSYARGTQNDPFLGRRRRTMVSWHLVCPFHR